MSAEESPEKRRPARLGILDGELIAAALPATKDEAARVRAALGYLSGRDIVKSPDSGWLSVRVDPDVLGGAPARVMGEVGDLVDMGIVKPELAVHYLGSAAVEALTDGRIVAVDYGDPDPAAQDDVVDVLESV